MPWNSWWPFLACQTFSGVEWSWLRCATQPQLRFFFRKGKTIKNGHPLYFVSLRSYFIFKITYYKYMRLYLFNTQRCQPTLVVGFGVFTEGLKGSLRLFNRQNNFLDLNGGLVSLPSSWRAPPMDLRILSDFSQMLLPSLSTFLSSLILF